MTRFPLPLHPTSQHTPALPPEAPSQPGQRGSRFWIFPVVFLALVGLLALALVLAPPDTRTIISVTSQLLSILFCLGCTLWIARRTPRGRTKWAWLILSFGQFSYAIGIMVIIFLANANGSPTSVSPADFFLLQLAPLSALGVILFPPIRSTAARQFRVILDVCIVVGALFALALIFLIIPRYASGTLIDYVFTAYPVVDVTLLLVLIVLLVRGVQRAYRPVLFWMMIGTLCLIYADTIYNYLSLPGFHIGPIYTPGSFFVDPFWAAGILAFSLAPLSLLSGHEPYHRQTSARKFIRRARAFQPTGLLSQVFLLAVPALVIFGLLIYTDFGPPQEDADIPLLLLALLVMLLIITRQLLTMHDLVDARIANERAEQLDALKDQFITSVNHELRTPLMTMQGYIELLVDPEGVGTPEKRANMLDRAQRSCANLVHLVQTILDTRRIEEEASDLVPTVVNVQAAAQAALTLIDPDEANPAGRHLSVQIPHDAVVWGDQVRVQQIMTNLLSNAIKYSSPDTPIIVTAEAITERKFWQPGSKSSQQRQMVEISVHDQGLGIPPDQKELLFRRFVRLPRDIASNIHGNGLGLYLCRVFAEAMDGIIWVESSGTPGEGSTFRLRLPAPQHDTLKEDASL